MIDIHCHIMPGVDDGADSYDEALTMAQEAFEAGTRIMAVTPHYLNASQCKHRYSKAQLAEKYRLLKEHLEREDCRLKLCLGAEHFGVTDIASYAEENKLIPLNGSHYVLIEFDFDDEPQRVEYVLSQLTEANYIPVIAHPERYYFLQEEPRMVYSYLDLGCLLQINKGSPLGRYGAAEKDLAMWLLKNRLPHAVASDCHSPFQRTPDMGELHEIISINVGDGYAHTLFEENPLKILKDEPVI